MMKKWMLLLLIGFVALGGLPGCSDDDDGTNPPAEVDQFETVRAALDAYLSPTTMAPTTTAQVVFDNLNDGNTANDPFILSVRSDVDDAKGHIAGAKTIPWRSIGSATELAIVPKNKSVVVYCYTGHTGAVATTCLNAMGYSAVNLKFGIGAWTRDEVVRVVPAFNDATDAHDFTLDTTPHTLTATYDLPVLDVTTSSDVAEILRAAVDESVNDATVSPTITAQAVFDNINDGEANNDFFILSVRKAEDYAKGHIPGAYNIFYKDIAKVENLRKLPPDKQIIVYCYTGHTGGTATAALRMLGYNAVNLKFGIMSWTRDATVRVAAPFSEATDAHDYPFVTGPTKN